MKKKFVIINLLLGILILFLTLFQSVHSYEHLLKQISNKECSHKTSLGTQFTHHHDFEKCLTCEATFSPFAKAKFLCFQFKNTLIISYSSSICAQKITPLFKGSLFALRAPPLV
ncbi:MAG: hypothetical protein EXR15_08460 [Chitinophagaceae bacterium]|nr:hypothetical protein [Chitinophagaceae bacterium]